MEQGIKSFADVLEHLPAWFQMVLLTVAFLLAVYFFFRNNDSDSTLLPLNFDVKLFKIQLLPSESRKAKSFDTGYHKLQYVKVVSLTDRSKMPAPVYTRCVGRLKPEDRNVPVYDEAVYYTLERFPEKRKLTTRTNSSSGAIDPRMIIPWQEKFFNTFTDGMSVPGTVNFVLKDETDTFLSVCHYANGLQRSQESFTTITYEKTNDIRLIVDLSSIPSIDRIIVDTPIAVIVRADGKAQEQFDAQLLSPGVYTVTCNDAMPDDALKIIFNFDRTRAARPL